MRAPPAANPYAKAPARALLDRLDESFHALKTGIKAIPYRGTGRYCPVCRKSSARFRKKGVAALRPDAQCPKCGALERHRFLWLYLEQRTNLFDGQPKTMLHVAPERCLEPRFRKRLGDNYVTADLVSPRAMVKMDITDIQLPDETFDVIYCSHVLEHVEQDRQAMREFRRVLKRSGWAVLLVPVTVEKTLEDPSVVDPTERARLFGHPGHVRRYGPDYADRLREAGFTVEVTQVHDLVDPTEAENMGLTPPSGEIYFCTR